MTRESTKAQEKGEPTEGLKPDILSKRRAGGSQGREGGRRGAQPADPRRRVASTGTPRDCRLGRLLGSSRYTKVRTAGPMSVGCT